MTTIDDSDQMTPRTNLELEARLAYARQKERELAMAFMPESATPWWRGFWNDVAGPAVASIGIVLGFVAVFAGGCGLAVFLVRLGWRLAALVVP